MERRRPLRYSGDPTRFATASRYGAYTGTATVEFSSGDRVVHRRSRGNRKLNHALHMVAVTQISYPHSPGRGYYDRSSPRGTRHRCDPRHEAAPQRHRLAAPRRRRPARRSVTDGPGQDTQERLRRLHDRLTPEPPALRRSHYPDPNRTLRPPASSADRAHSHAHPRPSTTPLTTKR